MQVDLASVDRGPLVVTLRHEGKTRVRDRYMISAPVNGRVMHILQESEAVVAAGTPIMEVGDDSRLEVVVDLPLLL